MVELNETRWLCNESVAFRVLLSAFNVQSFTLRVFAFRVSPLRTLILVILLDSDGTNRNEANEEEDQEVSESFVNLEEFKSR